MLLCCILLQIYVGIYLLLKLNITKNCLELRNVEPYPLYVSYILIMIPYVNEWYAKQLENTRLGKRKYILNIIFKQYVRLINVDSIKYLRWNGYIDIVSRRVRNFTRVFMSITKSLWVNNLKLHIPTLIRIHRLEWLC